MAVPADFHESNAVLDRPADMTADECTLLNVLRAETEDGTPCVVSCWKLTAEELEAVKLTGRIWLIVSGRTMPPRLLPVTGRSYSYCGASPKWKSVVAICSSDLLRTMWPLRVR